ncbi:hypothetical protein [Parafrankia elaeagni]|uniref:hypothetical protein n=1 Tax=Parafrankia elaeagni TaxID=222534 RepID=UPI00035E779A|nr:hypothetical protein [Parafrankia elaeagni]
MTAQTEPPPGATRAATRAHGSMTDAPPWIGGVTIGTLFLAAAVLITYTLLPLPGQRSLGDVNYLVAGLLFVVHITFNRLYRTRIARRATTRGQQSRPEGPDAPAE